jgi:hypothetical protein
MKPLRLAAILAIALSAVPAAAQSTAPATGPTGLTAFVSLGGGGAASGSVGDGSKSGILAAELGAGWDLPGGWRPEAALLLGLAPDTYLGLRPGVRYSLQSMPFFFRGALDFANPRSSWRMRWILAGAGAELRITDQLSIYGEADLGIPVASKAGFLVELRGGAAFRF